MAKAELLVFAGVICEALPNTMYLVRLENSREVVAGLSDPFRATHAPLAMGDRVLVESSPYDLAHGVITLLVD